MEKVRAQLKNLRIAPRKVRLVCGVIRGKSVNDAFAQLDAITARSAEPVAKLLKSAVANAKNKHLDVSRLVIESIRVDEGPVMKRFRARARGTANPIHKKLSHVTIVVMESEKVKAPRFAAFYETQKKPKAKKKTTEAKKAETAEKEEKPKTKKVKAPLDDKKKVKEGEPGVVKKVFRRKSV